LARIQNINQSFGQGQYITKAILYDVWEEKLLNPNLPLVLMA
jgi:hypothetical protein